MRALIQRVKSSSIEISNSPYSMMGKGLLILLGIENSDENTDIEWLSGKILRLRIFNDDKGIMNRSVMEENGEIMVVSQFTLFASTRKGNRPSYIRASTPEIAIPLYEKFIKQLERDSGREIKTGKFGADMQVNLINDGPVTIFIDTKVRE